MSGKGKDTTRGAPGRRKMTDGERRLRQYVYRNLSRVDQTFHLKLTHVLGGVSLLSLLAAFEVFSIPASSGIINILKLGSTVAGIVWLSVAAFSGGVAIVLHEEES